MPTVKLIVTGRVQGVGFRWHAQRAADKLGVRGYVRNLPNSDVEIVAQGSDEQVAAMISWAHQGPSFARVDHLSQHRLEGGEEFSGFGVRY